MCLNNDLRTTVQMFVIVTNYLNYFSPQMVFLNLSKFSFVRQMCIRRTAHNRELPRGISSNMSRHAGQPSTLCKVIQSWYVFTPVLRSWRYNTNARR